jgi:D-amino peptidase
MEGVAGVVHPSQGTPGSPEYRDACRLMALECNAAIEGALEAGVQEFVVNDSHDHGRNLSPADLHPAAELVSGSSPMLSMCAGLGPGFDAAFFIGYHASIGSADSVIDHTYDSRVFSQVRLNGRPQSEGSLNAAVAGYFDCPLALFTGDAAAVSEMHQFVLPVEGIVVKEGLGRYSARSLHPTVARQRIREGAKRSIERLENIPPLRQQGALDLEVDVAQAVIADVCELIPGVERRGPRTVGYAGDDYLELFKLFLALGSIGGTVIQS